MNNPSALEARVSDAPVRRDERATPWPSPFIVGVARSGTTLLRLMLDSHPELAIPPETGFLASEELTRAPMTLNGSSKPS